MSVAGEEYPGLGQPEDTGIGCMDQELLLEQITSQLFYAQYRLAMYPSDLAEDFVRLIEGEYLTRFGAVIAEKAASDQTADDVLSFVSKQRELRHATVTQALKERSYSLHRSKQQKLTTVKTNMRELRRQAETKTKERVTEALNTEKHWTTYELQDYQKNILAAQLLEDTGNELNWEHRILTSAAYEIHPIFSISAIGIQLDRC